MSHLDERISDLIDGRLSAAETETAHAHLARCSGCHEMVEAERLTKARLAALQDPAPSLALTAQLLAVGGQATAPPTVPHLPSVLAAAGVPAAGVRPVDAGPSGSRRPEPGTTPGSRSGTRPGTRPGAPRLSRRPGRVRAAAVMAGSLGVLGVGLFGASVVSPAANTSLAPSANLSVARSVVTMTGLPILNLLPGWRVAHGGSGR